MRWKLGSAVLLFVCHAVALNLQMCPTRHKSNFTDSHVYATVQFYPLHTDHAHVSLSLEPPKKVQSHLSHLNIIMRQIKYLCNMLQFITS